MSQIKQVPVDANGNWQSYPYYNYKMVDVVPFKAFLRLDDMYSGRSAKGFIMRNEKGQTFPMFVTDFIDAAKVLSMYKGRFEEATWTVSKRGQNYGIKLYVDKSRPVRYD